MDTDPLYPAPKRRKIYANNTYNDNYNNKSILEQKEEEFAQFGNLYINKNNDNNDDNESISSYAESIDSQESEIKLFNNNNNNKNNKNKETENDSICSDFLCKFESNPNIIIPSNDFTQTVCIFGGNYKYLKSMIQEITDNISSIINDYNFKLHIMNIMDKNNDKYENKTKLIHTMIGDKLMKNQLFSKISYQNCINNNSNKSKYRNCDICIVFPDDNINILCQIMNFINCKREKINENKCLLIGPRKKRILLVNIGGFFNGLKLQIINFTSNHLPNPINIVFKETFVDAIKQIKQWSK